MAERQMTVTEAAQQFADLINRTYDKRESTVLTRSGEPVARVVPMGGIGILGSDFAAIWEKMAHLESGDADDFAAEIESSRKELAMPVPAWD